MIVLLGGTTLANKLELTWYGKDEEIKVEPRILIENKTLSNVALDEDTDNMLIHGDNLLALKALLPRYGGSHLHKHITAVFYCRNMPPQ